MDEVESELNRLGINSTSKHNEGAPCQHEIAIQHNVTNIAVDQNMILTEIMQKVANANNLMCLIEEKPFMGVCGSGKHNNWSLWTNDGLNLLSPGEDPYNNLIFLTFLTAVIAAVDEYQGVLTASTITYENSFRLGGYEAPPAIISIYLGDALQELVEALMKGKTYKPRKIEAKKYFFKDPSDRNRTSPFAFCSNRFEFRMLGASSNPSEANTFLNTMVADIIAKYVSILKPYAKKPNFESKVRSLIKDELIKHKRIIFNGDGYSNEWPKVAAKRGLLNNSLPFDAITKLGIPKYVNLFTNNGIYSKSEFKILIDTLLDQYNKKALIDSKVYIDLIVRKIVPNALMYLNFLAETNKNVKDKSLKTIMSSITKKVNKIVVELNKKVIDLKKLVSQVDKLDVKKASILVRDKVIYLNRDCRKLIDALEEIMPKKYWPFPTYSEIFSSEK